MPSEEVGEVAVRAAQLRYVRACGELKQAAIRLMDETQEASRFDYEQGLMVSERSLLRAFNRLHEARGALDTERIHFSLALGRSVEGRKDAE